MNPPSAATGEVAVVVLAQMAPGARSWGWWRIVRGPGALRREPGLRFAKVLGSGHEGGFGLRPSASRLGLFLLFDGEASARGFIDRSAHLQAWRRHACECCVALLRTTSARGQWDGHVLEVAPPSPEGDSPERQSPVSHADAVSSGNRNYNGNGNAGLAPGAVAVLTRASIRPSRIFAFWRHAPPSEAALARSPGCRLAVGRGEAPLLRQATFSVWDSVADMQAYARGAAHGEAARAAYSGSCFSESLFARFVPLALQGQWKGRAYG